ncbi:MAG: glycosyltransferase family 2 protein [Pseudomonadota bacterium]
MKRLGVSVVIPALNEGPHIAEMLEKLKLAFDSSDIEAELIVVDDGSADETARMSEEAGARVFRHPCNIGYGNSVKTGVANAKHEIIAMIDADGTYPVEVLPEMVQSLADRNLDMLVGARQGKIYHGNIILRIARIFFRMLCESATGRSIPDVNSGMRVIRKDIFTDFWRVLCGGFSITTTITLVSLLSGRFVAHTPITYFARKGKSKIKFKRDVLWTLQLIVRAILLYNPIKAFLALITAMSITGAFMILLAIYSAQARFAISLASFFLIAVSIIMAMGFLAEQNGVALPDRTLSMLTKSEKP